uniref:F-box domain-containing protein n=1 Tax=Mycena chlorophos TaxID=658473 RepID=A0ABQ0MB09_MYCCL|nr:predicted protein [Mycena chlorophos]
MAEPSPPDSSLTSAQPKTLAPVYCLPNEILALIIELYAHTSSYYSRSALYNLSWTKVLLVCRWWYQVGRVQRHLWSYIHIERPFILPDSFVRRIRTQLENSGLQPQLTVRFSLLGEPEIALCQWLLNHHSSDVVSFDVSGPAETVHLLLSPLSPNPLTALRCLKLGYYGAEGLALPDEFLRGALPCLKELALNRTPLTWNLLHGLERLKLHGCANSASVGAPPNVGDILRLVQASPGLRALDLVPQEGDTFHSDAATDVAYSKIPLPFLEFLHIQDVVSPITLLLNHLTIPVRATLQLFPYRISVGLDIRAILIPLRKLIRSPRRNEFHALVLSTGRSTTGTHFGCKMDLVETPSSPSYLRLSHRSIFDDGHPLNEAALTLHTHPRTERALRQILTKFLHAARAELLTHLDTRYARGLGVPTWRALLRLLPALQSIGMEVTDRFSDPDNEPEWRESQLRSVVSLLEALRDSSASSSVRLLRLTIQRWIGPPYGKEAPPSDEEAAWLAPFLAALEAFVRQRRSDFDSDPASARSLDIVIVDERGFLDAVTNSSVLERIAGCMEGMGSLERKRSEEKNP